MLRTISLACALGAPLLLGPTVQASAYAPAPRLSVSPRSLRGGQMLTLRAQHVAPRQYYSFLYVPNGMKYAQRFLTQKRSDKHGDITARVALPRITYCGKATVYLLRPKKTVASAHVQVVGCKRPGGKKPPPPPSKPHVRVL